MNIILACLSMFTLDASGFSQTRCFVLKSIAKKVSSLKCTVIYFFANKHSNFPPPQNAHFLVKKKKKLCFFSLNSVVVICNYILWQIFSICIENKKIILDESQCISRECYRNHQIIVPNIG